MKKYRKGSVLALAVVAASVGTSQVFALGLPVIDVSNLVVNTVTMASNIAQNFQLEKLRVAIVDGGEGTLKGYTQNIDKSTTNIDQSTQFIMAYSKSIDKSTTHIDESTTTIRNLTQNNYDIDKTYNYYGDGGGIIIPIPRSANVNLDMLDADKVEAHIGHFRDADYYANNRMDDSGKNASSTQKKADDALAYTLSAQRGSLDGDADLIGKLANDSVKAEGHARQQQYANALAATQANQMVQMRSLMLASINSQAVSTQVAADKRSREIASATSLRRALDSTTPDKSPSGSEQNGL